MSDHIKLLLAFMAGILLVVMVPSVGATVRSVIP